MKLDKEIHESLYGRKKGARYKVANVEDRTWNGIVFHSKHEMEEYMPFVILEKSGIVSELKRQVRYPLVVHDQLVCHYVADWTCIDQQNHRCVYDAKGDRTELYILKRNLFHACYPSLRIIEL